MINRVFVPAVFILSLWFASCADLFQNGDLSFLAEMARGDISVSEPSVSPSLFQKRVVTNLNLSVKAVSAYEVVSVEADLSALGGGTVNLVKSGDTWGASLYIQSENAGSLSVRFIAKSKTGKIGVTNYDVNVFTYGSVYVATNGNDTNEGLTVSNAVRSIQKGVDIAAEKGIYEVLVSEGAYSQSVNGICVNLKSGLSLKGGYNMTFSARNVISTPSVIDGLGTATHVVAAFSVHNTIMDGFVIRNGSANGAMGYEGSGAGLLIINSDLDLSGLTVSNNVSVNMGGGIFVYNSSLTLTNDRLSGNSSGKGGGLGLISSSVTVLDTTLSNNYSPDRGGGMYSYSATLNMRTNSFCHNVSVSDGGAVYTKYGNCVIESCSFIGNRSTNAYLGGGAVQVDEGGLTVNASSFVSNLAFQAGSQVLFGGGLSIFQCSGTTVTGCYFYANACTNYGSQAGGAGVGMCRSSNIVVQDCTFTGNIGTAGGAFCNTKLFGSGLSTYSLANNRFYSNVAGGSNPYGGAVHDQGGVVTMNGNVLSYNSAGYYGGGVYATEGNWTMNNNILSNNYAPSAGGIYVYLEELSMTTNSFYDNISDYGGGAVYAVAGNSTIDRCLFVGNGATNTFSSSGGAIHLYQMYGFQSYTVVINNSYFSNNHAGGYGGAVNIDNTNVSMTGDVFFNNISAYGGGAIHSYSGSSSINSCTFTGNRTTNSAYGGGAVEVRQGHVTMNNNTLSYNYGDLGGAFKVGNTDGSLSLQGGTVSYSTNYAVFYTATNSNFTMSGVAFTGNYPADITN